MNVNSDLGKSINCAVILRGGIYCVLGVLCREQDDPKLSLSDIRPLSEDEVKAVFKVGITQFSTGSYLGPIDTLMKKLGENC